MAKQMLIQMTLSKDAEGIIINVGSDVTRGKKIDMAKLSDRVNEQMNEAAKKLLSFYRLLKLEVK